MRSVQVCLQTISLLAAHSPNPHSAGSRHSRPAAPRFGAERASRLPRWQGRTTCLDCTLAACSASGSMSSAVAVNLFCFPTAGKGKGASPRSGGQNRCSNHQHGDSSFSSRIDRRLRSVKNNPVLSTALSLSPSEKDALAHRLVAEVHPSVTDFNRIHLVQHVRNLLGNNQTEEYIRNKLALVDAGRDYTYEEAY